MIDSENYKHRPRAVDKFLRQSAESWWYLAFLFRFGVFGIGVLASSVIYVSQVAPFLVALLTLWSELCFWRYIIKREKWEALHRELVDIESFGLQLSSAEYSDFLMEMPRKLRDEISNDDTEEAYFASTQPYGPKRAVENIIEIAWWAKHISRRAAFIYSVIVMILVVSSFGVLIISIETISNVNVLSNIGQIVTTTVMLIFSLELIRTSLAYYRYSGEVTKIEKRGELLLKEVDVDMIQAVKLMRDYHIAHAEAPMIPHWLRELMREDLIELWDSYRKQPV